MWPADAVAGAAHTAHAGCPPPQWSQSVSLSAAEPQSEARGLRSGRGRRHHRGSLLVERSSWQLGLLLTSPRPRPRKQRSLRVLRPVLGTGCPSALERPRATSAWPLSRRGILGKPFALPVTLSPHGPGSPLGAQLGWLSATRKPLSQAAGRSTKDEFGLWFPGKRPCGPVPAGPRRLPSPASGQGRGRGLTWRSCGSVGGRRSLPGEGQRGTWERGWPGSRSPLRGRTCI